MNKSILLLSTVLLLAAGCAKDAGDTTGRDAQTQLTKWIERYYPGTEPTADGLYILSETPGDPLSPRNPDLPYIQVRGTIRTLDGTVSSTTEEEMARQLGYYGESNYYGPQYHYLAEGTSYAGMDALVSDMCLGGTRKAILPAWMLTTSRYSSQEDYIRACTGSTHLIYEITLVSQCEDAEAEGIARLQEYVGLLYPGTESCSYVEDAEADGSFYFISDVSAFKEEDKLADESSVKINYTGRRLDGTVFDTTLEKVAADARIKVAGKTYEPQSATLYAKYSSVTMGGSSSLINGFKGGLSLMHWKGQKAVFLFSSKHGYSSSGSKTSDGYGVLIPSYEPLIFEVEILTD